MKATIALIAPTGVRAAGPVVSSDIPLKEGIMNLGELWLWEKKKLPWKIRQVWTQATKYVLSVVESTVYIVLRSSCKMHVAGDTVR